MRKIGAPLALVNGRIEKNCIVQIDEVSKKIGNIAVNVSDMDSVASLEYFNGLLIPTVKGWEHPMTAEKKTELLRTIELERVDSLREGYAGEILLLERIDLKNRRLTPSTTIKKI